VHLRVHTEIYLEWQFNDNWLIYIKNFKKSNSIRSKPVVKFVSN